MPTSVQALACATVTAAFIAVLTATIGGIAVREPAFNALLHVEHPRYGQLFSRMMDLSKLKNKFPYPRSESFIGSSLTGNDGATGVIDELDCHQLQSLYVANKKWKGCHGKWLPGNLSLTRNVNVSDGTIRLNAPQEMVCDDDGLKNPFSPTWISAQDNNIAGENVAYKQLAQVYYRHTTKTQNVMFEACMAPKHRGYLSVYLATVTMLFTMAVSFACMVAPSSVNKGRGPAVYSALTVMIVVVTYFYSTMHADKISKMTSKVLDCRDVIHKGTMAPEDYYGKVPNSECYVARGDSMCEALPTKGSSDEIQLCSRTINPKDSSGQLQQIDFFRLTVDATRNCLQYTDTCNDPNIMTAPSLPVSERDGNNYQGIFDKYNNKTIFMDKDWCALCTHGQGWFDSTMSPDPGHARSTVTKTPIGPNWSGFGTSTKPDITKPCVWVHTALPIIEQPGTSPTMKVKANTCINRFDLVRKIDTHSCQKLSTATKEDDDTKIQSYPEFLFEYGHPSKCHVPENKKEGTTGQLNGVKYPDCVYENYEKCYVRRATTATFEFQLPVKGATKEFVPQLRGGPSTGSNTCVTQYNNATSCFCSCSEQDYLQKRCERTENGIGIMFDNHTNGIQCSKSATCAAGSGNEYCYFLGAQSTEDESMKRYVAENNLCKNRQTTEPKLSNYCTSKIQTGGKYYPMINAANFLDVNRVDKSGRMPIFSLPSGKTVGIATVRTSVDEKILLDTLLAIQESSYSGIKTPQYQLGYKRTIKSDGNGGIEWSTTTSEGVWSDNIQDNGKSTFTTFIQQLPTNIQVFANPIELTLCVKLQPDPYITGRHKLQPTWCDSNVASTTLYRERPWQDLCDIDTDGTCVSNYVECNDEQELHFSKLKEFYTQQGSVTPSNCLTNQEGEAIDQAGIMFVRDVQTIQTGISFLVITAMLTALLALTLEVSGADKNDSFNGKDAIAIVPTNTASRVQVQQMQQRTTYA
tara:strand:- start:173 stop:3100 length:2928 start_codon:yes stop_codon:yes gene_type:complete